MQDVVFRRATAQDVTAIVAMLADDELGSARESPGDPAYAAAFAAIDRDPNQLLAVAVVGGMAVGTLQLTFIPGLSLSGAWRGQIEAVRIVADRRGTGLGGSLVAWAVDQCRARGCRMVQLTTNTHRVDAHRFYQALGFSPSHTGFKLML